MTVALPFGASILLLSAGLAAQSDVPPTGELIAAFGRLEAATQERVLRAAERRVQLDPTPAIQRIVSRDRSNGQYPVWQGRGWHRPDQWAPGVAPPRKVIPVDSAAHRAERARLEAVPFLQHLQREVFYDWGRGQIVRLPEPVGVVARFANLAHGYPPASDQAVAQILATLDRDANQRALSAYLDHLYADVNGKVFAGITLYEAWYSGRTVNVPDVDSIPFAQQFLRTQSFRSPIPEGRRRTRLYRKIAEAARHNRQYRTQLEGAAAAFVDGDLTMDATYAVVVPRFYYLWSTVAGKPTALGQLLAGVDDRTAWIETVDQEIADDADKTALQAHWQQELQVVAERLRAHAAAELKRAQR